MAAYFDNGITRLLHGDARALPLPDSSVHCVVTSPPYWGLRNYGLGEWTGGDADCSHDPVVQTGPSARVDGGASYDNDPYRGKCRRCGAVPPSEGIGLEPTMGDWLDNMIAFAREVRRVLRDDGTFWVNLGDTYSGGGGHGESPDGPRRGRANYRQAVEAVKFQKPLPAKNLMGQPWRVAFALQDDGWILRSAIVWHKLNPMPESARDRPTSAYEMVFLFSKSQRYFYDAAAVMEPQSALTLERFTDAQGRPLPNTRPVSGGGKAGGSARHNRAWEDSTPEGIMPGAMRNARNVWTFPIQGRKDAHFATFPDELPRRAILAATPEAGVCAECGAPWARIVERELTPLPGRKRMTIRHETRKALTGPTPDYGALMGNSLVTTKGWEPSCACNASTVPATVLDPFVGSGTTVAVAQSLGRRGIGVDLNPDYLAIAQRRIEGVNLPLEGIAS